MLKLVNDQENLEIQIHDPEQVKRVVKYALDVLCEDTGNEPEDEGPEAKYKVCPKCGSDDIAYSYSPSEQEYPGASIWPSYHHWMCGKCNWEHGENGGYINGQENTRGW